MNHSFYSADRATHRRVVFGGLCAALLIAGLGFSLRALPDRDAMRLAGPAVLKAGKPVVVTESGDSVVR
jgi:hypothetical protein